MAKIVIDARESGTSTGRYIDKLIENIHILKPNYEIAIVTKNHRLDFFSRIAPDFSCVSSPFKEFSFGEQLGLKKQIESLKPNLVHFGVVQQPILYRGRVVTTMHDLTTIRFRNPSKNYFVFFIKQQIYKQVNKIAARHSRIVLTPSKFVKQDIINFTHIDPSKVVVTYEAADAIKQPPIVIDALNNKQFIMYVGRPTPHKNLNRLIEAFERLQKDMPDLHLVLAGKMDVLYEAHKARVTAQGIKNVVFTDFIPEGELRWLYEHTSCYVVPSLSEGFGLPGLEAMIHGAPVASSNTTCLPEVYGEAAEYFDPVDANEMAAAIKRVISTPGRMKELETLGIAQASRYSWRRMAEQTLAAYDIALSKPRNA